MNVKLMLFVLMCTYGISVVTLMSRTRLCTCDLSIQNLGSFSYTGKKNDSQQTLGSSSSNLTSVTKQQPTINLSFIKIHRVGSGTFHNVLVRFAINHNAFVALGDVMFYEIFPRQISRDLLLPEPQHPNFTGYNMFIDHVIFNKTASDAILPEGTRYITQVRHPYTHAPSIYMWLAGLKKHGPYRWYNETNKTTPDVIRNIHNRNFSFSLTRNMMALELGYYRKQVENNVTDFLQYLEILDKQLFHVNILEALPESLVLLKRKMNWELKDLLHSRIHTIKSDSPIASESELQLHRQWSSLDYTLYDHILARHKREVDQQDGSFKEEVEIFSNIQEKFSNFCRNLTPDLKKLGRSNITLLRKSMKTSLVIQQSKFQEAFMVTYEDCVMLSVDELVVKTALKYHMNPGVCQKNPQLADKLKLNCHIEAHILPSLTIKDLHEIL